MAPCNLFEELFYLLLEKTYAMHYLFSPSGILVFMVPVTDWTVIINQTNIYLGIEQSRKDK